MAVITLVNSTSMLCPLGDVFKRPGEYKILVLARSINQWLSSVLIEIHVLPEVLYSDWNLLTKTHSPNTNISLQMDQSLDTVFLPREHILRFSLGLVNLYSKCSYYSS